jgi:hypothetical protein
VSNPLAIAAVTATLRNLLVRGVPELPDQNVTAKPLDKARPASADKDQLNLFLYQTVLNAAWRNRDMPRQLRPGETGQPPLALNLHYLVTAFGNGDDDALSHRWLGMAMSVLHDHPVLGAQEIQDALQPDDSGLQAQIERVRITPQPMSLEELSKLWTTFQTQYRISAAYAVEVVLIESTRAARTPLPVLSRGKDDRGVSAQGNLIPPFPAIDDIQFVDPATSALLDLGPRVSVELGDRVAILGHHLALTDGDSNTVTVTVRFRRLGSTVPQDVLVPAGQRTDQRITVQIPNVPASWPAGPYVLSVLVMPNGKPEETRETNEWPLLIAPVITTSLPLTVTRPSVSNGLGDATINLSCSPDIQPGQRVSLALGDRELRAELPPTAPATLKFVAKGVAAGSFRVRLRVEGVDSHLLDWSDPAKPKFDDTKKVNIQ